MMRPRPQGVGRIGLDQAVAGRKEKHNAEPGEKNQKSRTDRVVLETK
jgi:hypothetical protein